MQRIALIALLSPVAAAPALAGEASGNGALALAARVAQYSPLLKAPEKVLLAKYLEGQPKAPFPPGRKITVTADAVACRISDVDITAHSCELTFGAKKVSVPGDKAQALYATLVQIGVASEGAAGSIFESVSALDCAVDPEEVKQEGGGGAGCKYSPAK